MAFQTLVGVIQPEVNANAPAATPYTFSSTQSPALIVLNTTAEQSLVVAAGQVQAGDFIYVNKPTAQAGLGIVGARVIDGTHVGVTFSNNTGSSITPTASEAYLFAGLRPGSLGATVVGVAPAAEAQGSVVINRLSLAALALVTGVATNNVTFNFRQIGGPLQLLALRGTVIATLGSLTLALGTNLAAEQEVVVASSNPVVLPGDVLDVQVVTNGTGMALPSQIIAKIELG